MRSFSISIQHAAFKLRIIPIALIDLYRIGISPFLAPACRFHPTCSAYARQAILKHGVVRGILKSMVRISRCHPFHAGGYDPVE